MKKKYFLSDIKNLKIEVSKPSLIFLRGDLGAGKTTLTKHIINDILGINKEVISPTYTYYNTYEDVVHFDLYRLKNYDEFFAIGWEDVLDNNTGVVIIEWPELIEKYYTPDIDIKILPWEVEDERELEILSK